MHALNIIVLLICTGYDPENPECCVQFQKNLSAEYYCVCMCV